MQLLQIVPWGFGKLLKWIKATYGDIEIVITENGVSDRTGTLEDDHRISYLQVGIICFFIFLNKLRTNRSCQ